MTEHQHLAGVATAALPVSSTYHGVTVVEFYRWLEDAGSEQTRSWTQAQSERTRAYLTGLPCHADVLARANELMRAESVSYDALRSSGGWVFALKVQPPLQQPVLVRLSDLDDLSGEHVVLDPNAIDPSGATAIDFYSPSPDGTLVAVSLSQHGTEQGTVHVVEVATGRPTGDVLPRVQMTGPGSVAWAGDSAGFWYTRFPAPGERPEEDSEFFQEVWFHRLGTSVDADRRDLAEVFAEPRIAENLLSCSSDGTWVLDRVQRGDSGEWEIYVRPHTGGDWWQVAALDDRVIHACFGPGSNLYLLSRQDAPRGRVLRLTLTPGATVAEAVEVVPTSEAVIEGPDLMAMNAEGGLAVTDAHVWVQVIEGGVSLLRRFDLDGRPAGTVDLPSVVAITGLCRLGPDEVAYATQSPVEPLVWWRVTGTDDPYRIALAGHAPLDTSRYQVWRDAATSPDGTRVPITVVGTAGTPRDGRTPVRLTGYGGYGMPYRPSYRPSLLPWLEQGWMVAVAHIRGGGEYGEDWHDAGRLANKQNCFEDFVACARHLVTSGLTSHDRLAIEGGSNGGLLMGAVLTQHPDLARAVVARVPLMDMLRCELHPNGVYNIPEFGSVEDATMFQVLRAYSPYHNVVDGVAYPAVLLTAGEFDPRVDAMHAKKMAARLQAATSSHRPVLLRVEASGHGMGSPLDQRIAELADITAFLVDELGLDYRLPAA